MKGTKKKTRSLRTRLLTSMVLLAVGPLLAIAAIMGWYSYRVQLDHTLLHQRESVRWAGDNIEGYLGQVESELRAVMYTNDILDLAPDKQESLLRLMLYRGDASGARIRPFQRLWLFDKAWRELGTAGISLKGKLPAGDVPGFGQPGSPGKKEGEMLLSRVEFDPVTGEPLVVMTLGLQDVTTGEVAGHLVALVRLKWLWGKLDRLSAELGGEVFVVAGENLVIAHPDPSVVLTRRTYRPPEASGISDGLLGERVVAASMETVIGGQHFLVVAEQPLAEVLGITVTHLLVVGGLMFLAIAAAILMGAVFIKNVVFPLERFADVAGKVGAGDLSARAEMERDDEIGYLAGKFNQMANALDQRERALRDTNVKLTKTNKELDEFTYIASHDLQEPLRKMKSFSTLLREDLGENLPAQAEKDLEYISRSAERMQSLVQGLLSLSRSGRTALNKEWTPLEECVEEALYSLSGRREENSVEIVQDTLPRVWGDKSLLIQLYQNLLGNALKYHGKDGIHIQLTAGKVDGEWMFGVRDNGIGLNPEYAEQIFIPFRRLHGRLEYEGTGIGLSICKKIVERHGGRIWVESEPGQGAHFKFTIRSEGAEEA